MYEEIILININQIIVLKLLGVSTLYKCVKYKDNKLG